jgi:outer membrane protein OmpA-like peptidoglycan-associated protein
MLPDYPQLKLPEMEVKHLLADVTHKVINSDGTTSEIVIEDFTQTNLKPLLNYIFFDENSSELPNRYKTITPAKVPSFNYNQFQSMDALETYYHCIDIVGYRLTQFENTTIELIGNNSNKGDEKNNIKLSKARAEVIKNYLCDVWKIAPNRIKVSGRNLPKEPTKQTDPMGDEENRRVEIYSSDARITEPLLSFDTISVMKNVEIEFIPQVESQYGLSNMSIEALLNDSEPFSCVGSDINKKCVWNLADKLKARDKQNKITYSITAIDKLGQNISSEEKNVPIKRITVASKRNGNNVTDKEFEYYSLILFDFASRSLDAKHNKVISFINTRVKPTSKIVVSGYTDIIGLPEINQRIATERAFATAEKLNIAGSSNIEIIGVGNDKLLYDNNYPEGRFYCRTVTISIETPIENR